MQYTYAVILQPAVVIQKEIIVCADELHSLHVAAGKTGVQTAPEQLQWHLMIQFPDMLRQPPEVIFGRGVVDYNNAIT